MTEIKDRIIISGALFLFSAAILTSIATGGISITINTTPSAPKGLYILTNPKHLNRGDYIIMNIPESVKTWLISEKLITNREHLLKQIGGLPGDFYEVTATALRINGAYRGPVFATDKNGVPAPKFRGKGVIHDGYIFPVATRIPRSFDGRYFGPIPVQMIVKKATPFLIWEH